MEDEAELRSFAELLMRLVRDQAIDTCDALAAGRMGGYTGRRWHKLLGDDERGREAVHAVIPEIVDEVLFALLNALDQGDLPLAWRGEDGSYEDLSELGGSEMAGDFLGEDGWRDHYSSQRFFERLSDG